MGDDGSTARYKGNHGNGVCKQTEGELAMDFTAGLQLANPNPNAKLIICQTEMVLPKN